jgi:hypothetical protein
MNEWQGGRSIQLGPPDERVVLSGDEWLMFWDTVVNGIGSDATPVFTWDASD